MTMNAPPPSSAASKLFLLVAVALGVLATILAFAFINRAGAGTDGPKDKILVATRDIAVNTAIDPERDLKLQDIPKGFNAFRQLTLDPQSKASYKSLRVNRPITAGQPIFLADLGRDVDYQPTPGLVAMPIQADPGIAIPGDYVKILVTRPDMTAMAASGDATRSSSVSTYAAKGTAFRVIAVSGSLSRTRSQVLASEASGNAGSKQVTIETTESQAAEIQAAIGAGAAKATLVIVAPPAVSTPVPATTGTKL